MQKLNGVIKEKKKRSTLEIIMLDKYFHGAENTT